MMTQTNNMKYNMQIDFFYVKFQYVDVTDYIEHITLLLELNINCTIGLLIIYTV